MPTSIAAKVVDPSLSSLYALAKDGPDDTQSSQIASEYHVLRHPAKPSYVQTPERVQTPVEPVQLLFHPSTFPFITGCVTNVTTTPQLDPRREHSRKSSIRTSTTTRPSISPLPTHSKLKRPPQPIVNKHTAWPTETRVPTQHWMPNEAINTRRRFFYLPSVPAPPLKSLLHDDTEDDPSTQPLATRIAQFHARFDDATRSFHSSSPLFSAIKNAYDDVFKYCLSLDDEKRFLRTKILSIMGFESNGTSIELQKQLGNLITDQIAALQLQNETVRACIRRETCAFFQDLQGTLHQSRDGMRAKNMMIVVKEYLEAKRDENPLFEELLGELDDYAEQFRQAYDKQRLTLTTHEVKSECAAVNQMQKRLIEEQIRNDSLMSEMLDLDAIIEKRERELGIERPETASLIE